LDGTLSIGINAKQVPQTGFNRGLGRRPSVS